jgi:hypothetical protein
MAQASSSRKEKESGEEEEGELRDWHADPVKKLSNGLQAVIVDFG